MRTNDECFKSPKKSFDTEHSNFSQLDFPVNHMLFASPQFKLADNFKDKNKYKKLKIHFHAILGNNEDEVWYLVKNVKVMKIKRDTLFMGLCQKFHYLVVRENNVEF